MKVATVPKILEDWRGPSVDCAGGNSLGNIWQIGGNQSKHFAFVPELSHLEQLRRRRACVVPDWELRARRLLYHALGGAGFLDFGAYGMQVIRGGDDRKQQRQETAQQNQGTKTAKPPRRPGGRQIMPPDENSGQCERQPEQIEEQFH
jgi:hypothetical protein